MTREEWYKHTLMDHVEAVGEYARLLIDTDVKTDMSVETIRQLYKSLLALQYDISKQLEEYEYD